MKRTRRWCALGAAALLGMSVLEPPASALAADYIWDDGEVSNHNWPAQVNWDLDSDYPRLPQDTATFPAVSTAWDCRLTTNETIQSLTVEDNVSFDSNSSRTLTVDSFTIDATGVQETDNGIYVHISATTRLVANP